MSHPTLIDTANSAVSAQIHEEARKRGAAPFVCYMDEAHTAAMGIEAVVGLLRRDATNRELEDDAPGLSAFDIDALLGLAQFAARKLQSEAERISTWADKHFVREEQR